MPKTFIPKNLLFRDDAPRSKKVFLFRFLRRARANSQSHLRVRGCAVRSVTVSRRPVGQPVLTAERCIWSEFLIWSALGILGQPRNFLTVFILVRLTKYNSSLHTAVHCMICARVCLSVSALRA